MHGETAASGAYLRPWKWLLLREYFTEATSSTLHKQNLCWLRLALKRFNLCISICYVSLNFWRAAYIKDLFVWCSCVVEYPTQKSFFFFKWSLCNFRKHAVSQINICHLLSPVILQYISWVGQVSLQLTSVASETLQVPPQVIDKPIKQGLYVAPDSFLLLQ